MNLKHFLILACCFIPQFNSDSVASEVFDLQSLQDFGFDTEKQINRKIADCVSECIDRNISNACEEYGSSYWANDNSKYYSSFVAQKKLFTLALTVGTVFEQNSIANKYIEIISTLLSQKEYFKDCLQKVASNLNGLYFYISCCCFFNKNMRDEYFRRIRHDQKFATHSVTNFSDYLFLQTDFIVKRLLESTKFGNIIQQLNAMNNSYHDSIKHDWYCYATQLNIFGEPLLPGVMHRIYEYKTPDGSVSTTITERFYHLYSYADAYAKIQPVYYQLTDSSKKQDLAYDLNTNNLLIDLTSDFFKCGECTKSKNYDYVEYKDSSETWDEYGICFGENNSIYNFRNRLYMLGVNSDNIERSYPDSKSYPLSIDDMIKKFSPSDLYKNEKQVFYSEVENIFNELKDIIAHNIQTYQSIDCRDYNARLYGVVQDIVLHKTYQRNSGDEYHLREEYSMYFKCLKRLIKLLPTMNPDYIYNALRCCRSWKDCDCFVDFIETIINKTKNKNDWNLFGLHKLFVRLYKFINDDYCYEGDFGEKCKILRMIDEDKELTDIKKKIKDTDHIPSNLSYNERVLAKCQLQQTQEDLKTTLKEKSFPNFIKKVAVEIAKDVNELAKTGNAVCVYKIFETFFQ